MKHSFFFVFFLLAMAALAEDAAPILEGPASVEFPDSDGERTTRLAVRPGSAKIEEGDVPYVVEFSMGDLRLDTSKKSLQAKWEGPAGAESLVLILDSSIRRPGAYRAILAPLPKSKPLQRLTLQITLHAATLKLLPEKLVVDRRIGFFCGPELVAPPLSIMEESGVGIRALSASSYASQAGLLPTSAGIVPSASSVPVKPRGIVSVPYNLIGDFPLGVVNGKLLFAAEELAESKVVDYEVRSRLSSSFIPFLILLGMTLGYFVRVYLAKVISVAAATDQATVLKDQIADSMTERPDEKFWKTFEAEWSDLARALKQGTAVGITAAVTALDTKWRAALTDFAQREQAAQADVESLRQLVPPPLPLPAAVRQILLPAEQALNSALSNLKRRDVWGAQREINAAVADLGRNFLESALDWQDSATTVLKHLSDKPPGLPASVTQDLSQRVNADPKLDRIKAESSVSTAAEIRTLELVLHAEFREVHLILQELWNRLETEWNLVKEAVKGVRPILTGAFDDLEKSVTGMKSWLLDAVEDPPAFLAEMPERLQTIDNQWQAAILEPLAPEQREALKTQLADRLYLEAARAMAKLAAPDRLLKIKGGALPAGRWTILEEAPMEALPFSPPQVGSVMPPRPKPLVGATVSKAKFLQVCILGFFYATIYWMINKESFGQSWSEPAVLLVSSFLIDLTADGLIATLGKLKGS